ncbi:MORC family CW-type Zinc finger protein 3-like [Plakobranchus ocellatus]|uniref:MORC family CW-type Zinc finger protein 3-like n=1 Tax=Plakobranchus ocellatus TaxID=259542 RepID=A0AAV4BEG6_9GAST|nr:MORC family CW-type Zinc finger protein 3-like [Plakobranchus ocellatus]
MASVRKGIPLSKISPAFLHANSTSHTWVFSAFAEIIDNAYDPDVSASDLLIDTVTIRENACLIFLDNGAGMDKDKLHKMLSQESRNNLNAILTHSVFKFEEELKEELRALEGSRTGTKIIISNLKRLQDGNLELDFSSDQTDIRCPEAHEADMTSVYNRPIEQSTSEYKLSLRLLGMCRMPTVPEIPDSSQNSTRKWPAFRKSAFLSQNPEFRRFVIGHTLRNKPSLYLAALLCINNARKLKDLEKIITALTLQQTFETY